MKRPSSKRNYIPSVKPFDYKKKKGSVHRKSKWTKLSKSYRKDNPLCEIHNHYNHTVAVEQVDHIIRLEDGGAAYDRVNLMSVCNECHYFKTGKEKHKQLIQYDLNEEFERIPKDRHDIYTVFKDKLT